MRFLRIFPIVLTVVLAACGEEKPPQKPVSTPVDTARCGSLRGVVRLEGTPPKRRVVSMSDATCKRESEAVIGAEVLEERCVATPDPSGTGHTLKDAFVWISKGLEGRTFAWPDTPVVLDQKGCMFTPHVVGAMTWQEVNLRNSDPVAHNVSYAKATANRPFNVTLGSAGASETKRFGKPESAMRFACDVHPWMDAYVHVVPHPHFAVTTNDGRFEIGRAGGTPSLPEGDYVVSVWTQAFGTKEIPVKVVAGATTDVVVPAFTAPKD